ncbi:MAG: glycine cleavage system aminomethyltransferase GcvT [Clostridia bacterium]|nr:glycine cleavage system aminomethyltransferase GcvT [Clostridia bacterium]
MAELKRTPLYEAHLALGAKMVDFGGWEMPVQYSGIIQEHHAVRQQAGLFDVCHMGEIIIRGPEALKLIQYLITNDFKNQKVGQCQYGILCYPHGGTVDDLIVYRLAENEYMLVVNASNTDKDLAWIQEHAGGFDVEVEDASPRIGLVALQGPKALEILQKLADISLAEIKNYWFAKGKVIGKDCLISRTGYTGEDGFEIYCQVAETRSIWDAILKEGEGVVLPCGLGARDSLRFEMKMPLYGHELSENITPLEALLGRFVALDKEEDFIGKEALAQQKAEGVKRKIRGFEMIGRGIARQGYPVKKDGQVIGEVTSGMPSPSLGKNLGMALIKSEFAEIGTELDIEIRGKDVKAIIIKTPFYQREAK